MGVCCSNEDNWEDQEPVKVTVAKKLRRKKKKHFSVIQEQKSQYDASFASILEDQLRNSLYQTIEQSSEHKFGSSQICSSVVMGSVVEMNIEDQNILEKKLINLNPNNQQHTNQLIRLCNFKTKNFLHTHKVKLQKSIHFNQVSCCPYDANHNIDYDTWKLQKVAGCTQNSFYIYHPFTKRYLQAIQNIVAAGDEKYIWTVQSLGIRRNQGFVRLISEQGQLCMSDSKALVKHHRAVSSCTESHISHLWQLIFVQ